MDETPTHYTCEDCGIVRHISELTHGCPICGKTMVPTDPPPYQHIKAKQGGKGKAAYRDEHEPSIADLMVQASIDRAMGEPVEDWLADMLP